MAMTRLKITRPHLALFQIKIRSRCGQMISTEGALICIQIISTGVTGFTMIHPSFGVVARSREEGRILVSRGPCKLVVMVKFVF